MAFFNWKIVHTKYVDGWSTTDETILTNFNSVLISVALGQQKDTFSFKVRNINGRFDDFFNTKDLITIYRERNTDTFTSEPLFMGIIQDTPNDSTYNKNMLTVKGYGFSEYVLGAHTFTDPEGAGFTISYALQDALAQARQMNSKFGVTWSPTNPILKSDDTEFPKVEERFLYKPLRDIFEKYSTNSYTDDGYYYWYVNVDKELVWKRGDDYDSETYNYNTDSTLSFKYSVDSSKIINYVICKCGVDPAGSAIASKPVIDEESKSKYGVKFHLYVDRVTYIQELNTRDLNKAYNNAEDNTKQYPDFTSNFELAWKYYIDGSGTATEVVEGITCTDGSYVTIPAGTQADQEEKYIAILRKHGVNFIRAEAWSLIKLREFGLNKADLVFKSGEKTWGIGSKINMTLPMLSSTALTMRIKQIQFSETTDTYSLEQEATTVVEE